jgi:hypothetical protein
MFMKLKHNKKIIIKKIGVWPKSVLINRHEVVQSPIILRRLSSILCCGSALVSMRCRIWIRKAFYLIADPDPKSRIRSNADLDTDPGQTLLSLKVEFYMKNILYGGNRS